VTLPTLPTASAVDIAERCPSSQVIPAALETSDAMEAGTLRHAALDNRVTGFGGPPTDPETKAWLDSIDDEHLEPLVYSESEVTYSWDPYAQVAARVGHHLDRNYPRTGMLVYGTADYVRIDGDVAHIDDLKTGHSDTGKAVDLRQLRTLALMVCRTHGCSSAVVGILHATGSATWWDRGELDSFDLSLIQGELSLVCDRVIEASKEYGEMGKLNPLPGRHCGRCKGRWACPAYTAQIQALADPGLAKTIKSMLTPEMATQALVRYQAAKTAVNDVGRALMAYAAQYPIDVGGGRVWGPVVGTQKTYDADVAWPVLVELLGAEGAIAAVAKKTSKAGIERGVEVSGFEKGKKAAKVRGVLEALEKAGAVGEKFTTEYEEHIKK